MCPIAATLNFIGDRWTTLILCGLLGGSTRFQDLRNDSPVFGANSLTKQLVVELEVDCEYVEVILDQRPMATARPSSEPVA